MILKNELLIYPEVLEQDNVYLCTVNDVVKKDGCLVMGAGNALAYKEAYPGMDAYWGAVIKDIPDIPVRLTMFDDEGFLGIFQTKRHWRDPADIDIIARACRMLKLHAETHPDWIIHLPFPGIGLGGVDPVWVVPLIDTLPDNVIIYKAK